MFAPSHVSLEKKKNSKGRILLFSYAFPPLQSQMPPAVVKPMAALSRLGYDIDVVSAEVSSKYLSFDDSLLPYVSEHFNKVIRLTPEKKSLFFKIASNIPVFANMPDVMHSLRYKAFSYLMDMDLSSYRCVMTWSPFHSINSVMVQVKKYRNTCWIAQFSDPWAGNPLETNMLSKLWSRWQEPYMIDAVDFIVHSSQPSLNMMVKKYGIHLMRYSTVIPHCFDASLFPERERIKNKKIKIRYIGTLFRKRSPNPFFNALKLLLEKRPDLEELISIEIIGRFELSSDSNLNIDEKIRGMITHKPQVSYLQSLEYMYDADILLLIEANVKNNLFFPSKLSDYIGANVPIIGIVGSGESSSILKKLGSEVAHPEDTRAIVAALERTVERVMASPKCSWYDQEFRNTFSNSYIAEKFEAILEKVQ